MTTLIWASRRRMGSLEPTAQSVWQRQLTRSIEFVLSAVSSGKCPGWVGYLIIIGHSFCCGCIGDWIKPKGDHWSLSLSLWKRVHIARNPRSIMLAKRQTRPRKLFNKPVAICSNRIGKAKRPKYVDLSRPTAAQDQLPAQGEHLSELKKLFSTRRSIVVISGAGISVNAGSKSFVFPIAGGDILIFSYSSRLSYSFWA
jgi:hypothetical protein